VILFYILLSQQDHKKTQESRIIHKTYKPQPLEPVLSSPKVGPPLLNSDSQRNDASPLMDDDLGGMADIHTEQKAFIRAGIDGIFASGVQSAAADRVPLKQKQINQLVIHDVTSHIASLKSFRTEQVRLQRMINDPAVRMPDFSKMVLSDPMLTAKILRMANSSYFGMEQKIDSISHALMILGLQNVKNIIYREGMRWLFQARRPAQAKAVGALWKHSSITSVCASALHDLFDGLNMGTLFTLGIIHDIGKLILLELPQAQEQADAFWNRYPMEISIWEEDQWLGINHEIIGKLALEQWKFSELMTNVISMHHAPSYLDADRTGLTDEQLKYVVALFLADQIAKLFADWNDGVIQTYPLLESYHGLIDKNKLVAMMSDTNLLGQIREAEAIAAAEENQTVLGIDHSDRQIKVRDVGDSTASVVKTHMGSTTVIKSAAPAGTIGRYEIIRELGRGAMGVVYLAMDPLINREVAIKTLRYQDADEKELAESRQRFFSEAKAIGKLSHSNIVNVYDVGEHKGTAYIAMEFLDGTDLIPYCEKDNLLPLGDIVRIIVAAARALDYAHQNGIVHRDVKPGNIRILKNGDIKVIDFGIARVMEPSKTHSGIIVGSPSYMSPEQINGQALDGRSDLFSLGAIFYELLTGERPFSGANFTSLLLQITTEQPKPVANHEPAIAAACMDIIGKALAKDKNDRYQRGRDFADDLVCLMEKPPQDMPALARPS
jgi:HD-like signal output (HDOD) protein/tRNA A-37 threonylcarbamoyl transferase component Bud32